MTDQFPDIKKMVPITPPPELVQQLQAAATIGAITTAYQAGADQELEACCKLMNGADIVPPDGAKTYPENKLAARERMAKLRAARRPKPPSLKKQALGALDQIESEFPTGGFGDTIRRALEQLDD